MLARARDVLPMEQVSQLGWDAPTFTAVGLTSIQRRTAQLATDALGAASLVYTQPAILQGALVFQAIVHDVDGAPLGTSTFVLNQ
jgi:hypothetical protein